MVRTPTTRAPSPAFLVHRAHFPAKKAALVATIAPRGIYNPIQNNQNVIQSKLGQSSRKEDLPRSSSHLDLKLMPMLNLDLQHAKLEQKEILHPMNGVKIVRLAHPVQRQPLNANPATRESSVTKTASPAKSAPKALFKIKTQTPVPLAKRAQRGTPTVRSERVRAKTWATKKQRIATNFNTSTTRPPTQQIGRALGAQLEPLALATSIGTVSKPNSGGRGATTTTPLLNVVRFPGRVWVAPTLR